MFVSAHPSACLTWLDTMTNNALESRALSSGNYDDCTQVAVTRKTRPIIAYDGWYIATDDRLDDNSTWNYTQAPNGVVENNKTTEYAPYGIK